jgi:DinB superfamily
VKNVREYYSACVGAETPKFVNVLKAVPPAKAGYRPDPRSTSAGDLVWQLACELEHACQLIDTGSVEFAMQPAPPVPDAVAAYEKHAAALATRIKTLDDAKWDSKAKFIMGGKVAWEAPLGDMLFGFLFDAIHHRGQLSSYLRPMGAKVPSIYGPSADDPGM